jgi:hypothetical protein
MARIGRGWACHQILAGAVTLAPPGTVQPPNGRYHPTATVLAWVEAEWSSRTYVLTRGELSVVICNCGNAQPEDGEEGAPRSRVAPRTCKHIIAAALSAQQAFKRTHMA